MKIKIYKYKTMNKKMRKMKNIPPKVQKAIDILKGLECSRCGCRESSNNKIIFGPDPYNSEVNGDDTQVWECLECRRSSADDV